MLTALVYLKEPQELMKQFLNAIDFIIANNQYNSGLKLLNIIIKAYEHNIVSNDEYFQFAKYAVKFYLHFKCYNDSIDLMCECAFAFSSVRAYQSAYRLISDAQEIVINNNLWERRGDILFTQGSICIEEGDYDTAEKDLENAKIFIPTMSKKYKFTLISNLATLKMKTGKHSEALMLYNELLSEDSKNMKLKSKNLIRINITVCQYNLEMLEQAKITIDKVIASINSLNEIDYRIEAYLIANRVYMLLKNNDKALSFMNKAISLIECGIESTVRLHYRRGYRENYTNRIEERLLEIEEGTIFDNIIDGLVFSKINVFSDWLSILEWYKNVTNDKDISETIKNELEVILNKLTRFGAPILYGFHEKYDDPFDAIDNPEFKHIEELDYSKAWLNFNLCMEKITNNSVHRFPFKYSSVRYNSNLILERIEHGSCYVFIYSKSGFIYVIYNSKKYAKVVKFDCNYYIEFLEVLMKYQIKYASFNEFILKLQTTIDRLSNDLIEMIADILEDLPREIVIIPDRISYKLPIISVLMKDENIRLLIKNSKLKLKYCPIIYRAKEEDTKHNNYMAILTPADDLPLLNEELIIPTKMLKLDESEKFDLSNYQLDFNLQQIKNADIIHIASHGFPISLYTDPIFASISGNFSENSLTVETIQSEFWKLNHRIVLTNACDSADISFRNYQKIFLTNELISYSSLFMLNGKSSSIAVNWPIKDIMSFVFSYLYYEFLSKGNSYQLAYGLTITKIYDLTRDELISIISTIEDEDLRREKLRLFANSHNIYPLRNAYCYGAYIFTGLV